MSNLTKGIILVVAILAVGAGLVFWKKNVGGAASHQSFNSMTRPEVELLLSDVAKTNPMILKKLAEDPEMKKQQIENLKQLLAFASEAQRMGLTEDKSNKQELDNIRSEVLAVNYDREINKDKGPMPPFGFITEEMINGYWANGSAAPAEGGFMDKVKGVFSGGAHVETRSHEDEFNDFLATKIEMLKLTSPDMKDREISDEEKKQARDIFAKTRIYRAEYEQKVAAGELDKQFVDKANLQVKLQQAQFLARVYSEKTAEEAKVTDEEINQYIAAHPEFDPAQKRAKAQGILDRAKAGEDFAALANEFSEDPGNKGPEGALGGIYKDVPKGRMVAPFEAAALALEAGQVSPELVETDFGFHIIKLERKLSETTKDGKKEETYDVRHILISTGFKDPDKPNAREMPVKDYVRNKLETEKEKGLLEKLVAQNNVTVPEDFTVPEISEAQIEEMKQKQQQQMMQQMPQQPGAPGAGPQPEIKVEGGKPAPADKKKK